MPAHWCSLVNTTFASVRGYPRVYHCNALPANRTAWQLVQFLYPKKTANRFACLTLTGGVLLLLHLGYWAVCILSGTSQKAVGAWHISQPQELRMLGSCIIKCYQCLIVYQACQHWCFVMACIDHQLSRGSPRQTAQQCNVLKQGSCDTSTQPWLPTTQTQPLCAACQFACLQWSTCAM